MKKLQSIFLACCLIIATPSQAGIVNDVLANAKSMADFVLQKVSTNDQKNQAANSKIEAKSMGSAGQQNEKPANKKDQVSGDDTKAYAPKQLQASLNSDKIDETHLQGQVQETLLRKPATVMAETPNDLTSRDVAQGAPQIVEITPEKDANVPGSLEITNAAINMSAQSARALAMLSLVKLKESPNVSAQEDADIKNRKTEIAQVSGQNVQNSASASWMDQMIAVASSYSELIGLEHMQDKYQHILNNGKVIQ